MAEMGENCQKTIADYGTWSSPITSNLLIGGNCKTINELRVSPDGRPFWVEQTFPQGKKVLFGLSEAGQPVRWSPEDVSVSNSVHEYGGGSVHIGADGQVICQAGGIWQVEAPGAQPRPIISNGPEEDVRHADIVAQGRFVYAVQERHDKEQGEPRNRLVRVDMSPGGGGQCQVVSEGADFYAEPRVSPDGRWLAWIQWDNPHMSWERTQVHVMELLDDGGAQFGKHRVLLDNGRSNFGLAWAPGPTLWTLSDIGGSWNVHGLDHLAESKEDTLDPKGLVPAGLGEIGDPLWLFDMDRPFVILDPKLPAAIGAVGEALWELDGADTAPPRPIETLQQHGFNVFHQLCLTADCSKLFCLASGPRRAISLVQLELGTRPYAVTILREARDHSELAQLPISTAESLTFPSDGVTVQGYFYPPFSHTQTGPPGQLPPALLLVHGGPTGRTTNALDMNIQYFTSRGFAVFDINYRGSSGFGREFRDHLNGQWGVVDRDDLLNGAKFLISTGRVDPSKVCIMGGSAGGFTALSVLMHPDNVFAAAVSKYGVSDLEELYKGSHKFEKENTSKLIAPYPEGIQVYHGRSPLHNIHLVNRPVAFLHGTDDPVVPAEQSRKCHASLKARGVATMLREFPGEAHGFKKADTVALCMDMAYCFLCRAIGIKPSVDIEMEIDNLD